MTQLLFLFGEGGLTSFIHAGGYFFMIPILLMLLLSCYLIIRAILAFKKGGAGLNKNINLLNSIGLLTLVWGVLGQLIGLVSAFDRIEMVGDISTAMLASGLKISALPTIFGCFVFVVSRIATTIFIWVEKESKHTM